MPDCDGSLVYSCIDHIGEPTFAIVSGDVLTLECAVCGNVVCYLRVTGEVEL
jgi:translation initiation factor 2 beta subunit (eIF-2beta)/eIF-5